MDEANCVWFPIQGSENIAPPDAIFQTSRQLKQRIPEPEPFCQKQLSSNLGAASPPHILGSVRCFYATETERRRRPYHRKSPQPRGSTPSARWGRRLGPGTVGGEPPGGLQFHAIFGILGGDMAVAS